MSDSPATESDEVLATSVHIARKRKPLPNLDVVNPKRVCYNDFVPIIYDWSKESPDFRDMTIAGTSVDRRQFRRVGPYLLGPKIGTSPVDNIVHYLGRLEGTNEFVQLKILLLDSHGPLRDMSVLEDRLGKLLLHNEVSVLSMLAGQKGVIQCKGLFTDEAYEEDRFKGNSRTSTYTGQIKRRLVLALECLTPHQFCDKSKYYIDLQQHLLKVKKLEERDYIPIFRDIVRVVESMHKCDIIHRDLKLSNIVLNLKTREITLINFCLGKHLLSENDKLYDQQGSPAYISPEVLSGKPYKGKPIDVWALGVILYMMVYGHFPFYESSPTLLFKMIKAGKFAIPLDLSVSFETQDLIRGMLEVNVDDRLTITQVRNALDENIPSLRAKNDDELVVPNIEPINSYKAELTPRQHHLQKICRRHEHFDQMVPQIGEQHKSVVYLPCGNDSSKHEVRNKRSTSISAVGSRELSAVPFQQLMLPKTGNRVESGQSSGPIPIPNESNVQQMILRQRNAFYLRNRLMDTIRLYDAQYSRNLHMSPSSRHPENSNRIFNYRRRSVGSSLHMISPSTVTATVQMVPRHVPRPYSYRELNEVLGRAFDSTARPQVGSTNTSDAPQPDPISQSNPTPVRSVNHSRRISSEDTFEALFSSIRQGMASIDGELMSFEGTISFEFAHCLAEWLLADHGQHNEVQRIFGSTHDNVIPKVYMFMRRCGFEMDNSHGEFQLKRHQRADHLTMLKALLNRSGYSSSYFAENVQFT